MYRDGILLDSRQLKRLETIIGDYVVGWKRVDQKYRWEGGRDGKQMEQLDSCNRWDGMYVR
jgi:hypothetical protein